MASGTPSPICIRMYALSRACRDTCIAADGDAHQLLILDIFLTLASSTGLPQMEHSARLKAQSGRCR